MHYRPFGSSALFSESPSAIHLGLAIHTISNLESPSNSFKALISSPNLPVSHPQKLGLSSRLDDSLNPGLDLVWISDQTPTNEPVQLLAGVPRLLPRLLPRPEFQRNPTVAGGGQVEWRDGRSQAHEVASGRMPRDRAVPETGLSSKTSGCRGLAPCAILSIVLCYEARSSCTVGYVQRSPPTPEAPNCINHNLRPSTIALSQVPDAKHRFLARRAKHDLPVCVSHWISGDHHP